MFLLPLIICSVGFRLGTCAKNIQNETKTLPSFGKPMLQEFLFAKNFSFFNHGAFGAVPKVILNALHSVQTKVEEHPDLWFRKKFRTGINTARKLLADLLNCDSEDVVIIPNVTFGINSVLRSLIFKIGERILYFSTAFISNLNLIEFLVKRNNGKISSLQFNITYPISDEVIISKFDSFLRQNHDPRRPIRIAVLEHISSTPAVINPLEKLIPILKIYNISILVDGAQAVGQLPVNITSLDVDFYVGSITKWSYVTRGFGVMYIKRQMQGDIHPVHITSRYQEPANFTEEFFWTGTLDYSPFMILPVAFKFIEDVGGLNAIRRYCRDLALEGSKKLLNALGTDLLESPEQIGYVFDVRLPLKNNSDPKLCTGYFADMQFDKYNTSYVKINNYDGKWYARVSAQIYNDLSDFDVVAENLLKMSNDLNNETK